MSDTPGVERRGEDQHRGERRTLPARGVFRQAGAGAGLSAAAV
ncbi:hypothetical protein [Streptomyces sp. SLBN-8D4]